MANAMNKAARRADEDASAASKRQRTDGDKAAAPAAANDANVAAINEYVGFVVPNDNFQIERVHIRDVTPRSFFERFVATRTPVVLEGIIQDEAFTAPAKWSNAYLKQLAGEETLAVERRGATSEKFGKGVEVPMQFKELLDLIASGDEMHYLTTQDVEADGEDGRPELMAPFVAKLQQDFPLRPELLGHLVPQNINIWMGNNKDGSSSGLHHDYHDNLYILLRGKKRFRLYSPAEAHRMYTRGKLVHVHANGRINYEGEETTAYGADPLSEAAALASMEKEDAERELEAAEQAVEVAKTNSDKDAEKEAEARLEAAEDRLDKAMMALLRVERDEDSDCASDPEDGEFGAFHFDEDEDEGDDSDENEEGGDDEAADGKDKDNTKDSGDKRVVDKTVKDPVNFSRIDTFLLREPASKKQLLSEFPLFADAKAAFCDLSVGEMLFLPASWFHEVESFGRSAEAATDASGASTSADGGHLALNYWYHPPDALHNFEKPYSSPFWPRDWELRSAGTKKTGDADSDENEGDDDFEDEGDDFEGEDDDESSK